MIEALVGVFLMAILSMGIYASYAFGLKISVHNRLRTEAVTMAEKKIEAIRAMEYKNIGVQGGIPPGILPATENETSNGTIFSVKTSIRYVDDALDDKAPIDPAPADYKQVEVKVNWPTNLEDKNVILNTLIAPPRVESNVGTGVLVINTVDSQGNPISDCNVHIKNNDLAPPIDLIDQTDINGSLSLPGIPSSDIGYAITVSKSGYESAQTYPPYPTSTFNPIDLDVSIAEGAITSKTFVIDLVSHQNIHFADIYGTNLPDLTFSLTGGKVIGTTVEAAPKSVYVYDQSGLLSDAEGKWNSPEIGKGPYYLSIANEQYNLITTNLSPPWSITAGSTTQLEITMGSKTDNILVVIIRETGGETPVVDANVKITDSTGALFQEAVSDINGVVYFPKIETPPKTFIPGENYNIDVTKDGYLPGHEVGVISGLTDKTVILSKQ